MDTKRSLLVLAGSFLCPEVLFSCGICAIINERQREIKAGQSAKGGLLCT